MEYIVVGTRVGHYGKLRDKLDSLHDIECIITGDARGVDTHAKIYARRNNIPYRIYHANWEFFGRSAGWRRNNRMAQDFPDAQVIAFWDGKSPGTKQWFTICEDHEMLPIEVVDL